MRNTFMQMEEEFALFEQYKLSPNELFFLRMLLLSKEEDSQTEIHRYFKLPEFVRGSVRELLASLQEKGIVLKTYTIPEAGGIFNPLDVPISQNFQKQFFKASFDMGKELYDHYPTSTVIDGVEYKLRRVSKKFNSLEDAFRAYGKYIRWSPANHQRVIELVEEAKANGYQFTNLGDFIVDNDWNNIDELRDNGMLGSSNLKQL